jgi:hypothetical protein
MRNAIKTLYILPILIVALMAACSAPEEPAPANDNAAPQATQNQAPQPTVLTTPVIPEPQQRVAPPPVKAPEPAVANGKTPASQPAGGTNPKLFVPKTVIDFGKQPKQKSLARTFVIKNTGNAELKIDAVEPS